jgi:hypothetical protein
MEMYAPSNPHPPSPANLSSGCFYINLPFGVVTVAFVVAFLRLRSNHHDRGFAQFLREIDIPGNTVFMPAVICLLLALQWGGSKYDWSDGRIIALLVVFGVLIVAFVAIQVLAKDHGIVPIHIVRNRNIWGTMWFCFCLGAGFFLIVFYVCALSFLTLTRTSAN